MDRLDEIVEFQSSPGLLNSMKNYGIVKEYPAGTVILNEQSCVRSIPIITRGVLKVLRTEEDGREILLYYITAGESCIMSFLGGLLNEASKVRAEVEENAEIVFLPIEKVSDFIKEYPQWLTYIFRLYHKRFEELLDIINAIAFKKVDQRLMDLLEKKSKILQSNNLILTHEQLANELGTARVVVSRLLKSLEDEGKVKLGRNKIELM